MNKLRMEIPIKGTVPDYGSFNVIKNSTGFSYVMIFGWNEYVKFNNNEHPEFQNVFTTPKIVFSVLTYDSQENYNDIENCFKNKEFHITIGNEKYNLGKRARSLVGTIPYEIISWYEGHDSLKFGTELKKAGETKRLCMNWI
ncbi:hypothetical protein [Xenorhabdus budapestensis]|nr:hypothetical protein [Xenorhabdus budapestensis]